MPVVDGWTVLRKLHLNPDLAHMRVIVMTAVDRDTIRLELDANRFQVSSVLQKPSLPEDVAAAVRDALNGRAAGDCTQRAGCTSV